jgi:hypothetical protein
MYEHLTYTLYFRIFRQDPKKIFYLNIIRVFIALFILHDFNHGKVWSEYLGKNEN